MIRDDHSHESRAGSAGFGSCVIIPMSFKCIKLS